MVVICNEKERKRREATSSNYTLEYIFDLADTNRKTVTFMQLCFAFATTLCDSVQELSVCVINS